MRTRALSADASRSASARALGLGRLPRGLHALSQAALHFRDAGHEAAVIARTHRQLARQIALRHPVGNGGDRLRLPAQLPEQIADDDERGTQEQKTDEYAHADADVQRSVFEMLRLFGTLGAEFPVVIEMRIEGIEKRYGKKINKKKGANSGAPDEPEVLDPEAYPEGEVQAEATGEGEPPAE